jgi:hypothetical protein
LVLPCEGTAAVVAAVAAAAAAASAATFAPGAEPVARARPVVSVGRFCRRDRELPLALPLALSLKVQQAPQPPQHTGLFT